MRLHNAISHLVAAFTGWDGFLKDPNYVRIDSSICWANQHGLVVPEVVTRGLVLELSKARQFTFRVSDDDSLIQIAYRYSDDQTLVEARLAYYELGESTSDDELFTTVPLPDDDIERPVRWMRIDYKAAPLLGVLHAPCHLHLSGHPRTRFAVKGVPTPQQFVELVIANYYPDWYGVNRLSETGDFRDEGQIDSINAETTGAGGEPRGLLSRVPHFLTPGF